MTLLTNSTAAEADTSAAARRTAWFVNIAHALDHFTLLIYATAVIALLGGQYGDYGSLIKLSTGSFVAFGVLALPVGFYAQTMGRRNLMILFYFGTAASCLGMATANSPAAIFFWLLTLGVFTAIYHPIGASMLMATTPQERIGRTLGINGVFGNMGVALAPVVTGVLTSSFGWRSAFIVPAIISAGVGVVFILLMPKEDPAKAGAKKQEAKSEIKLNWLFVGAAFVLLSASGGMTFNILTVALPEMVHERLGNQLLWLAGSLSTVILFFGALSQVNVGLMMDRYSLPKLLMLLSSLQPIGFALASLFQGIPMLIGLCIATIAIFGNVVIIDAMVARYIPDKLRPRVYGVRYFAAFAVGGTASMLIGWLHDKGGSSLVLEVTGLFGLVLFLSTVVIWRQMRHAT